MAKILTGATVFSYSNHPILHCLYKPSVSSWTTTLFEMDACLNWLLFKCALSDYVKFLRFLKHNLCELCVNNQYKMLPT